MQEGSSRVTEQLVDGLVSPTESPEKSSLQSPPKGFVLAGSLSPGNLSIGDGYLSEVDEPELTISMPMQGQFTPRVKDLTSEVKCVRACMCVVCVCMHVRVCTCISGMAIKFNDTYNTDWMGAFSAGTAG